MMNYQEKILNMPFTGRSALNAVGISRIENKKTRNVKNEENVNLNHEKSMLINYLLNLMKYSIILAGIA